MTTHSAGKIYGQSDPSPLSTADLSGFYATDGITATISRAAGEDAGSYAITTTLADPNGKLGDYNVIDAGATFTIGPATPAVTVTDPSGTYTSRPFTATGAVTGLSGANLGTPAFTYYSGTYTTPAGLNGVTPLPAAPADAGNYTVLASYAGSVDYTAESALATFTISPETLTAQIAAVAPSPRDTPVASLTIQFRTPVSGFDLNDLTLTWDGGANLLTSAQTLTTTDQQNWTLSNLAGLTAYDGTYQLTLHAAGSGIVDGEGTPLASDASTAWVMSAGTDLFAAANGVVRIVSDTANPSRVDVYINNTGSTPTLIMPLAGVSQWQVFGNAGNDQLIVDFSQGDPLPAGGLLFDGGSGSTNDSLLVVGTAGNDNVTVTGTQVTVNGAAAIGYSNVAAFGFNLGAGNDSLTIDGATLPIDQNNAISAGTAVTITDGGVLDLNGYSQACQSVTLQAGSIMGGMLAGAGYGLDGSAGLVVSTSGTAVLAGDNSYSGGTVVTKGTLLVTNSGALPPDGSLTVGAGSCLVFDPGANLAAIAGSQSIGAENSTPAPALASGNGQAPTGARSNATTSSVLIAAASVPEVSQVAAVVGSAANAAGADSTPLAGSSAVGPINRSLNRAAIAPIVCKSGIPCFSPPPCSPKRAASSNSGTSISSMPNGGTTGSALPCSPRRIRTLQP